MEEISGRVALLREMISSVSSIPLTEMDMNFQVVATNAPDFEMSTLFFSIDDMKNPQPVIEIPDLSAPAIFTNSLGISWLTDIAYKDGQAERIYLLGPVFLDGYSINQIETRLNQEQVSIPVKQHFMSIIKQLPIMTMSRFFEYGVMLRCAITGNKVSTNDFIYPYLKPDVPEDVVICDSGNSAYLVEQQLLKLIEEGNLAHAEARKRLVFSAEVGRLADGDNLRQAKNTVIVNITLSAAAAVRGGLSADIAYYLRSEYIRRIENAENLAKVTEINRAMMDDYVRRVHRAREANSVSPQIRDTCEYISLHLEEKLDIHLLASRLGYTDYYFSKRFKKETSRVA